MSWFPTMTGPPWYSIVWSVRAAAAGNEPTGARTRASVMQKRASFDPMVVSSSLSWYRNGALPRNLVALAQTGPQDEPWRLADGLRIRNSGPRYHFSIALCGGTVTNRQMKPI